MEEDDRVLIVEQLLKHGAHALGDVPAQPPITTEAFRHCARYEGGDMMKLFLHYSAASYDFSMSLEWCSSTLRYPFSFL